MSFQRAIRFIWRAMFLHGVETLSATRVLDTFSPPRTDYLAIDEKVLHGAL